MPPRPLKPGTKIEFISKNLDLTNEELVDKAKSRDITLNAAHIDSVRWILRTKYGYKNTGTGKRKLKAGKKEGYAARGNKKKAKEQNGVSPERSVKHAALRKLVFELGYDEVRTIFLEFEEMHNRWG